MKKYITILFTLLTFTLFGQRCEVSNLPFCVDLNVSQGIGNDRDTLQVTVDGVSCHGILLPSNSVSTITEEITTIDHDGSGYKHENGFNDTDFGYYLEVDADGCLLLLTWEGVQSGAKFCP